MSDFFFVVKTFVLTVFIVFLMQIKIGPATIEQHSLAWLQNSVLVDNLRAVADGAIKVGSEGYAFVAKSLGGLLAKGEKKLSTIHLPSHTSNHWFKRSPNQRLKSLENKSTSSTASPGDAAAQSESAID